MRYTDIYKLQKLTLADFRSRWPCCKMHQRQMQPAGLAFCSTWSCNCHYFIIFHILFHYISYIFIHYFLLSLFSFIISFCHFVHFLLIVDILLSVSPIPVPCAAWRLHGSPWRLAASVQGGACLLLSPRRPAEQSMWPTHSWRESPSFDRQRCWCNVWHMAHLCLSHIHKVYTVPISIIRATLSWNIVAVWPVRLSLALWGERIWRVVWKVSGSATGRVSTISRGWSLSVARSKSWQLATKVRRTDSIVFGMFTKGLAFDHKHIIPYLAIGHVCILFYVCYCLLCLGF